MSEQRAVPEIPEDFTVRCHDCGGTQIWKRVNAGEIETYHGCFNGKQSREAFATLTAEVERLNAEVLRERTIADCCRRDASRVGDELAALRAAQPSEQKEGSE